MKGRERLIAGAVIAGVLAACAGMKVDEALGGDTTGTLIWGWVAAVVFYAAGILAVWLWAKGSEEW